MKYLADRQAFIWSAASGCFDLVWRCCQVTVSVTDRDSTDSVTSAYSIYMLPTSNNGSRKYYLWKKISWKIDLFFL